ncbi:hypothetical protein FACS189459_1900 [Bacilli bacterium]|nr:hypothetical protein FACS189459_1900 [Bacilli bacterium]
MNKKNILFSIITPLTIASATLVTVLPLSISNNNSNIVLKNSSVTKNVFSVDGTD